MKKLVMAIAATIVLGAPAAAMAKDKDKDSNGQPQVEHCDETLGTLAVVEDQDGDWYRYLTSDLHLGSLAPLLRMMVQQSNCFAVVERGRAMRNMRQERSLEDEGELRSNSKFGKGQMVAADYTLNPSINFSQNDAGGVGAAVGGLLGHIGGRWGVGAVGGSLKFKRAETIVTMIDNRSGVQIASAQGQARKTDFGLSGWGFGSGLVGGAAGGYTNTPEGKVLAAAFVDAYNNMVRQLRNYKPQQVKGGLGKGGRLKVGD